MVAFIHVSMERGHIRELKKFQDLLGNLPQVQECYSVTGDFDYVLKVVARDLPALARIDMAFHWQFFEHCPSPYVRAGYEVLRSQLTALRHRSPIDNAVKSHQVLVDAVGDGDVDAAGALLREHVLDNEPRYRAARGGA